MCWFKLPTTIFSITSAKHKLATNQNFIIQKFQQKSIFIQHFLKSILTNHFNITSLDTILHIYQQKTEKYKQYIYNLLQTLPKLKKDSQLSVDEIIETLQNSPIIQTHPSNPPTLQTKLTASKLKFYVQALDIQTYIKQHYS